MMKLKNLLDLPRKEIKEKDGEFGKSLEEERLKRGVTKATLAKAIGVTPVMISRYEQHHVVPSAYTLAKIGEFFEDNLQDELADILKKQLAALEEKQNIVAEKLRVLNELQKTLEYKKSD